VDFVYFNLIRSTSASSIAAPLRSANTNNPPERVRRCWRRSRFVCVARPHAAKGVLLTSSALAISTQPQNSKYASAPTLHLSFPLLSRLSHAGRRLRAATARLAVPQICSLEPALSVPTQHLRQVLVRASEVASRRSFSKCRHRCRRRERKSSTRGIDAMIAPSGDVQVWQPRQNRHRVTPTSPISRTAPALQTVYTPESLHDELGRGWRHGGRGATGLAPGWPRLG
jgi:hypothetical protein